MGLVLDVVLLNAFEQGDFGRTNRLEREKHRSPFFSTPDDAPWASGNAPISRFPAEGVVTDVIDALFHIICPCGAKKIYIISMPENAFSLIFVHMITCT